MEVKLYETGQIEDSLYKFAVVAARYQGKWVWCLNRKREAWELPGGKREPGETVLEAAGRELREETGAADFDIRPVCAYSVAGDGRGESFGMLYLADIQSINGPPDSEIERIGLFDEPPAELSFPLIQPKLFNKVINEVLP